MHLHFVFVYLVLAIVTSVVIAAPKDDVSQEPKVLSALEALIDADANTGHVAESNRLARHSYGGGGGGHRPTAMVYVVTVYSKGGGGHGGGGRGYGGKGGGYRRGHGGGGGYRRGHGGGGGRCCGGYHG
ncbi:uncharacterized protein LOC129917406 [Episyrphus balteatus]|uniref:uncharacterized protein LOC129917406 n=1 Tax=Episyrphus balteatus TaxID=286459 RepID=UPI002485B23C|nr:uncharacterized protein LOC129917406 [Episyrphus balteatus]